MSLQDKPVVLLPPYATTSIYTVVKEYEHKGTAKVRLRHPTSGSEHSKIASEIRIASDEEQACGHRIDPHKAFEEWFKAQPFYGKLVYMYGDRIFDFDYADQTYRTLTVNVSWLTWQERQSEVGELQKRMDVLEMVRHGQRIGQDHFVKQLKDRHANEVSGLTKAIKKFDLENDQLQKRLEQALKSVTP